MSTRRLQKALETIGHPEFFQNFEDEGMDDEAVDICMDDDEGRNDLKPIFNKSGIFLKFVKAYKELRNRNLNSGNGTSFMTPTPSSPTLSPKPSFMTGQPMDDFDPPHPASRHLTTSQHQNTREKEYESKNTRQGAVNLHGNGNSDQLEPVQIIDLILKANSGVDTQLILMEDNLTRILKNVRNRRVAVLSIAGPSRQGKSFLLGYMIKYLRHVSGGRRSTNWMGESESDRKAPLQEGFSWRNGVERETTGISMWPEPFTLTSKNGSEFDVLLVDTQGVFDHYTEEKDWATIVGLSLLTSSALIFNISKHLQEDSLKSLKGFMDFGLMAMDSNDESEKPFQSLTFLIRDWNNASQFNYGARGGADFLKYQLNQKHTDSGGKIREQIKDSFEQLHCFLMPDPGENVKDIKYDGSVAGMAPNFASSIQEFIEHLFDPNTFPLMTISGNPVTGLDLLTYFKKYVEIFNSDKVPSSDEMNRAMTTICNQTIVNKCVATYETQFEELRSKIRQRFLLQKELQDCHTSALKEAISIFDKSRKMGSPFEMKQSKRELQEEKLETIFNNFRLENKQEFRAALDTEIESLKRNFEESVATKKSAHSTGIDKFLSDETLETILKDAEEDVIKTLQANLQISNLDSIKGGDLDSISGAIKEIGGSARKDNQLLKSEAESALNKFLDKLVQSFTDQLTKDTQGKYVTGTEFEEYLKSALDTLKSEFSQHYQTSTFFKYGEKHLEEKTYAVRDDVLKKIESNRDLLSMSCKEKMNEFEKKYERDMSSELDCGSLLNSFSKCHEEAKSSSLISFTSSESAQKLPPDEVGALKSELSSRLDLKCADFAHKSIKEKRTRLLTQFKSSLLKYDESFESDDTLVDDSALQELYDGEKAKAAQDFEDFVGDIHRTGSTAPGMVDTNLGDMDEEAELHRKKVLSKNEALQLKYEIQLKNFLKDSADAYGEELKEISKGSETEADFNEKALAAMTTFLEEFERRSKSSTTSPSLSHLLLPPLLQELEVELEKRREQELEVVLLKIEQDEAELKYAVPEVKRAYRDEMDKVFDQKRGRVSLKELLHHHRFVSQSVLDKYKQTNELPPSLEKEIQEELDVLHKGYRERVKRHNTSVTPAIGIDLGTTYSCVAVIRAGNVEVVKNTLGEYITPSYVHFPDGGGRPVVAGAKSEAFKDPENTVFDAKRLIGRKFTDQVVQDDMKLWPFKVVNEGNSPKIQIRGKIIPPEQIASHILSYLKQSAEEHLNLPGQIKNAVITVPAYFSDAQRQATKDAGEIAGLNVLKIINEPTAAAIAYGLDFHDDLHKNVLIFDLGGGTFDVAVLHMKKGDIHVKAVGGDTHLGGEDFDNQLVKYCLEEFRTKTNVDLLSADHTRNKVLRRLRNECEKMKRQLSEAKTVNIQVEKIKDGHDLDVRMTRDTFEGLCAPMFQKCITEVEKTLKDAKLDKTNIDDIVLVGGSTRIPKIKEMLQKYFNGKTLMQTKSSDEIVAHGAAILACSLNPGQDENDEFSRLNLEDVTPFSLGIEIVGDILSVIIPKNTPTPHSNTQLYYTTSDNQTSVSIKIYEGENPTASQNRLLGQFLLEGIPPAPARQEKVNVKMELNSENILSVTAVGASRGNEGSIKITSHTGRLNRSEIEKMKSENEKTSSKSSSEKEARHVEDEYDYGEEDDSDF